MAVAKYQLPTAVGSRMPSYLLISLLVQTPGPLCSLHVQTCCISVLNSPFLVPTTTHIARQEKYFTQLLVDVDQIVKVHLHLQWDLLQDVFHCSFFVLCL